MNAERFSDMNLLIADDEAFIRQGLCSLKWADLGIDTVLEAENGIKAESYLKQGNIDLMICDIRMPGKDGIQLSELVSRMGWDTQVIILSGYGEFEYAQQAIHYDVYEYLLKPVDVDDLMNTVRDAIKKKKEREYRKKIVDEYESLTGDEYFIKQLQGTFRMVDPQMMDILLYMAEHYPEDISLSFLSEKYHFTNVYLSRYIKKQTGFTFMDILTSIRLEKALDLLENSNYEISEICYLAGFRDQRYFSRLFRRMFGNSPNKYRKKTNNQKWMIQDLLLKKTEQHDD